MGLPSRILFFLAISIRDAPADGARCDATVVFQSGSEVYDAALTGIRESLANTPYNIEYFDLAESARRKRLDAALLAKSRLVVALGVGVWDQLDSTANTALPALVRRQDLKDRRGVGAVYADVSLPAIAANLRTMFPGRSRLVLIHRPPSPGPDAAVVARLKQMGFELTVIECAGPEKLLAAFASARSKADFVVTEPDPELYNSATVKPLVLASLESRVPIVGFSPAFVRAGALVGVYPDFHELGCQTGEMVLRILDGRTAGDKKKEEDARKVVVALNDRIARLMGIEPADRAQAVILK